MNGMNMPAACDIWCLHSFYSNILNIHINRLREKSMCINFLALVSDITQWFLCGKHFFVRTYAQLPVWPYLIPFHFMRLTNRYIHLKMNLPFERVFTMFTLCYALLSNKHIQAHCDKWGDTTTIFYINLFYLFCELRFIKLILTVWPLNWESFCLDHKQCDLSNVCIEKMTNLYCLQREGSL